MANKVYFDECAMCVFHDCSDDTFLCLANRLRIPVHTLLKELNLTDNVHVCCGGFVESRKEKEK